MDKEYVDRLVEIKSRDNGWYRGYVVSIDTTEHLLVLRNVKDLNTGELRMNNYHIYGEQITELNICDDGKKVESSKEKSSDAKESDLMAAMNKSRSDVLLMDASDDGPSLLQQQYVDPTLYLSDFKPTPRQNVELVQPAQRVVVDRQDETYNEAIKQIKLQKVISFALEGKKISRQGDVSMLVIATRPVVYFFDIVYLPPECLSGDLKMILEDRNILKVVFDVRMMSDYLGSLSVYPMNVFDCQVADLFIYKQKHGQYPTEVPCLADCLQKYLNIRRGLCLFDHEKKKIIANHERIWLDRPFPEEYIEQCYKSTMFTRELRDPMIRQLLAEFLCGVDMYLEDVRSRSDHEVKFYNSRKIPKSILSLSSVKKTSRKKFGKPTDDDYEEGEETCNNPWSTGVNFQEKYHEIHGDVVECVDYGPDLMDKTNPILKTTKKKTDTPPVSSQKTATPPATSRKTDTPPAGSRKKPDKSFNGDQSKLDTSALSMVNNPSKSFVDDSFNTTVNGDATSDNYASEWSYLQNDVSDVQNDSSNMSDFNGDLSGCNGDVSDLNGDLSALNICHTNYNDSTKEQKQKKYPQRCSPDEKQKMNDFFSIPPAKKNIYTFKSIRQIDDSPYSDACDDNTKPFDEYRVSTSEFESDDSEIYMTSVTDKPHRGGVFATAAKKSTPPVKKTPNTDDNAIINGWPVSHSIGDSGKRMINRHLNLSTRPKTTTPLASKITADNHNPDMNEFPPLSSAKLETNGSSPSWNPLSSTKWTPNPTAPAFTRSEPSKSPFTQSLDEIERSQTPEYDSAMSGVQRRPSPQTSKQSLGRGKTLQFLATQSKKQQFKKGFLEESHQSVPFPPDEELLRVPLVAKMVEDKPILGETVSILKKFPSPLR